MWEAAWGKVFNSGQASKKGVLPSSSLFGCQSFVGYLFLLGWDLLGLPQDGQGSLAQLERLFCGEKKSKIWKSASLCIFWTVWK